MASRTEKELHKLRNRRKKLRIIHAAYKEKSINNHAARIGMKPKRQRDELDIQTILQAIEEAKII